MTIAIPQVLLAADKMTPEREDWLCRLPELVASVQIKWSLEIGQPYDGPDVSAAWVAPVVLDDGGKAVLKVGMPHFEADHEAEGLRFWSGNPTVELLAEDKGSGAILLESCEPGNSLRRLPEDDQDIVISSLLRRIWRRPDDLRLFRPLSDMLAYWAEATRRCKSKWTEPALVKEGLDLFEQLSKPSSDDVLLATDLHAGNVLEAERESWLVIDPKPFIGDPAYDVTQHLLNCKPRMMADPNRIVERMSRLVRLNPERVGMWIFARAAAEPRDIWDEESMLVARALSHLVRRS